MVEYGNARLEAHGHAGAIDFHQNIVRKVCHEVEKHHHASKIREFRVLRQIIQKNGQFCRSHDQLAGFSPVGHQAWVKRARVSNRQHVGQPLDLLPCQPLS